MNIKSRPAEKTLALDWWVEIVTIQPRCIYYFGPIVNLQEAQLSLPGYTEDLEREGAQGINIQLKRCQPQALTVFEDELDSRAIDALCMG
jgi:hypothetical protein